MGQKRILQQVTDFTGEHRRDLDARRRILAATLRLLAQHGYTKLTIGGVATEASVGKATIYRSWPNKAALVLDAVRDQLPGVPDEDTGDSRTELLAVAGTLADLFGSSKLRAVLLALVADSADNSELGRHLKEDLIEGRKAASRSVVVRAVERGLLPPDTDVSLVLDSWAGTMLFRSLFSEKSLDEETVRRVVDATLASPPRLPAP
ncbi:MULTISPECIES: TetR/AcrR family transcriptional regulator [Streptomyces]|uniref:TetR/AcrR family transcriptional regulator n=1 Tax=Streptomyces morookaense TaxID=1970 RepID=A0A7Y7B2K7_STRMO|nr:MULTISPECIES: TetR/AcrR family transcriptional regulator [Streptomyces]MCC2278174.1 TetR/AcrR family transcriptional regulator [Streptomyces sp. ET3-23]NVK77886.1 TetR/AcrR family transcriptional regulator [Streptomyces morookaense]GHF20633.1 TetR family transcriptional regulator [Streptomyces morookaense]